MASEPASRIDPLSLPERLQGLCMLAQHLVEPVIVLDRKFKIVYRNPAARNSGMAEAAAPCYSACAGRDHPCELCPAMESFATGVPAIPSTGESLHCRLTRVVPIPDDDHVHYVAGVLESAEQSVPGTTQPDRSGERPSAGDVLAALVGHSEPMEELKEMIRLVAGSEAAVLLQGESGTGKELVARIIHRLSSRRDQPFVVVDCGSLPETLLESELFGHVKGAFTGAVCAKKGMFEEAEGGTILLDEIADSSAHFQSKLLRVLQEAEIKPVGGNRPIPVNVRVISATNKNLLEQVANKQFRGDLYYRLAVLPLDLPPLRERREDIPVLVVHFLRLACQRHAQPLRDVAPEALQALLIAPWRGNVRELKHVIERAVVTSAGTQLKSQDFLPRGGGATEGTDLRAAVRGAAQSVERAQIIEALRESAGKKASAARRLGISRASLYNKLRTYRIQCGLPE